MVLRPSSEDSRERRALLKYKQSGFKNDNFIHTHTYIINIINMLFVFYCSYADETNEVESAPKVIYTLFEVLLCSLITHGSLITHFSDKIFTNTNDKVKNEQL
jgi:hypothetical protein